MINITVMYYTLRRLCDEAFTDLKFIHKLIDDFQISDSRRHA